MYNVLIIEDNPHQSKNLINIICKNIPELRIYNISFDAENSFKIIDEQVVDIILLDLKLPKASGIDIIEYIENNNLYKYNNSIIITSGELSMLTKHLNSPYIFSCHSKSDGYYNIIKSLKSLIDTKNNEFENNKIKDEIYNELNELNYNFSYNGTKYLAEAIFEIYKLKDTFDGKLEKRIYSIIAQKYNKKPNTIYCNIKQATKIMLLDCPENIITSYFHYTYFVKPKIKEIIFTIVNKI